MKCTTTFIIGPSHDHVVFIAFWSYLLLVLHLSKGVWIRVLGNSPHYMCMTSQGMTSRMGCTYLGSWAPNLVYFPNSSHMWWWAYLCSLEWKTLSNTWGVTALPLKGISSRDFRQSPLEGATRARWCDVPSFVQVSLVNCSSNLILFATSEGSPF